MIADHLGYSNYKATIDADIANAKSGSSTNSQIDDWISSIGGRSSTSASPTYKSCFSFMSDICFNYIVFFSKQLSGLFRPLTFIQLQCRMLMQYNYAYIFIYITSISTCLSTTRYMLQVYPGTWPGWFHGCRNRHGTCCFKRTTQAVRDLAHARVGSWQQCPSTSLQQMPCQPLSPTTVSRHPSSISECQRLALTALHALGQQQYLWRGPWRHAFSASARPTSTQLHQLQVNAG